LERHSYFCEGGSGMLDDAVDVVSAQSYQKRLPDA
jgi:hypothetical protein